MPTGKPIVFVSYAHRDEPERPGPEGFAWLSFVLEYLNVGKRAGAFDLWVDAQMMGGANWRADIKAKLGVCDIFILLVSARSMASDFILDEELPVIRERDAKGEPVHIYPVLLTPTPIIGLDNVRDKNIRPRDVQPLSKFSMEHDRPQKMSEIADEIAKLAAQISRGSGPGGGPSSTAARLTKIDIGHLTETSYENLVGRDAELARLDAAWANPEVNILSLVAEGGAGKSALLNEWLTLLRRDNYRCAEVVLGWSFYSQGTHERATSSEQFLDWALRQLGATAKANSASAKGEAIAEAMTRRRVLLALDGVEPLQFGPTSTEPGKLKDQGLRALLRHFAQQPPAGSPGLIVLTSRIEVADIAKWKKGAAPVERIEKLSDAAGAQILADGGVRGSLREREEASRDFGGHPLALQLLASYLRETQGGDVRRRDHIRGLLADAENPGQAHARRVMESYEKEWLADKPLLLAILSIVGLFDRPADAGCLAALRAEPAIPGLTDELVGLREDDWSRAVHRLREARLLSPVDPIDPGALDAHPLVREWFGDRLRRTNAVAWKAAHNRIYVHLRDLTKEGEEPSLADLAPLYQAIAHGCCAGRYQEALDEVYRKRICRRGSDGRLIFYSKSRLGALASDLAAISYFFEKPYMGVVASLNPEDQSWVFGEAGSGLRSQMRLRESLPAARTAMRTFELLSRLENAATQASNLSDIELLLGDVDAARGTGEQAVKLAELDDRWYGLIRANAIHANALAAAGKLDRAEALFVSAEKLQHTRQRNSPLLCSMPGYRYCEVILFNRRFAAARSRATQTLAWSRSHKFGSDIALDTLILGRAHLGLALARSSQKQAREIARSHAGPTRGFLEQAIEGFRDSGITDLIPMGLLARAAFRRSVGDFPAVARDLDEVEEVAEPGPMRLFLCDLALERARLALARREAFAPLNGLVEAGPAAPAPPDAAEAARLLEEGRAQLAVARKLVADCGYHKRDEEVAELEAVLGGERRFADLPVHV